MKNLFSKLFIVLILFILSSSVVFADGAPSYNKNMYSVVVNNKDGATLYWDNWSDGLEIHKTVEYGTKFVVKYSYDIDGKTYLVVGDSWEEILISSSDVEIYGEPVSPSDLRVR